MSADSRLNNLLIRWQELCDQGQSATAEELCRDCPELLEPLRQKIEIVQAMGALFGGATTPVSGGDTAANGSTPRPAEWPPIHGYEIVRELGRGGMGVVYLARQLNVGRLVALKMILGFKAGPEEQARFRAEVEAIGRLQHPNLITIYEVGEHAGRAYYSMEYIEGTSLKDQIGATPQPARPAAEMVETLARAMEAVHRHGIIHRDLKPANILLSKDGVPKITDFGLAKRLNSTDLTATGAILGTPSYMAPEQATGQVKEISPATDVYALGAILYEMLTGRPPFHADNPWDTIVQVGSEEPVPPRRLQPKVPVELETICLKCLSKRPSQRYASAQALADDLRRWLAGEPIVARPIGPLGRAVKWAHRRPAAAALLVVSSAALLTVVVGALIYNARLRSALDDVQAHAEESRRGLVRLCVAHGNRLLEEDDAFAALVWFTEALRLDEGKPEMEGVHRIRIAATLRYSPRLVQQWAHEGPVRQAVFSRDGRRVLTTSDDHTARVWDAATGEPVTPPLVHQGAVVDGNFSPDGRMVLTASEDGTARLWSAETGKAILVLTGHGKPLTSCAFRPDGQRAVTTGEDGTARIWDLTKGQETWPPLRHQATVEWAEFSPDGKRVVTASDDHTARIWEADKGQAVSPPLRHQAPVYVASFHPDGTRVVTASADHTAQVWKVPAGEALLPAVRHQRPVHHARFSPDGRLLITGSDDHTAMVCDAETGRPLLPALRQPSGVNWLGCSADSRLIATANDNNAARVWSAINGEPLSPMLRHNGAVNAAEFSPDGRLLVTAGNDGLARVWDLSAAQRPAMPDALPSPLPPEAAKAVRWTSRDGTRLLTVERGSTAQVREAATHQAIGLPLQHGDAVTFADFGPENRLVITGSGDDTARIWDAATGAPLTPPLSHNGTVTFAAISPDGRLAVTASTDRLARIWDARTGEPVTPPLPHNGNVKEAHYEAGILYLKSGNGAVSTCDLRLDPRPVAELQTLAQLLAGSRIASSHGLQPLRLAELQAAWQALR